MTIDPLAPAHLLIAGSTVLVSSKSGDVDPDDPLARGHGMFDRDCRVLSRRVLTVDGERLRHASVAIVAHHRSVVRGIVPRGGGDARGPALPEDAIEVTIERRVGRGLVERIVVENHAMIAHRARVRVDVGADFRDTMALYFPPPD